MEPGEQTTGPRDAHYTLSACSTMPFMHGINNCNTYALNTEAAGEVGLAGLFREAGVMQTRLAERAKAILGIIEEDVSPEAQDGRRTGLGDSI